MALLEYSCLATCKVVVLDGVGVSCLRDAIIAISELTDHQEMIVRQIHGFEKYDMYEIYRSENRYYHLSIYYLTL